MCGIRKRPFQEFDNEVDCCEMVSKKGSERDSIDSEDEEGLTVVVESSFLRRVGINHSVYKANEALLKDVEVYF